MNWLAWRREAMELTGDRYNETAAMTWHAADRTPQDFARHLKYVAGPDDGRPMDNTPTRTVR